MQLIVTDVYGVCMSVSPSVRHAAGSFGAVFAKLHWPLVLLLLDFSSVADITYFAVYVTKSLRSDKSALRRSRIQRRKLGNI